MIDYRYGAVAVRPVVDDDSNIIEPPVNRQTQWLWASPPPFPGGTQAIVALPSDGLLNESIVFARLLI